MGMMIVTTATDPKGRLIVYVDPSVLDFEKIPRESLVRSVWYIVHAGLYMSEETQKDIQIAALLASGAIIVFFLAYWFVQIQDTLEMLELAYG